MGVNRLRNTAVSEGKKKKSNAELQAENEALQARITALEAQVQTLLQASKEPDAPTS